MSGGGADAAPCCEGRAAAPEHGGVVTASPSWDLRAASAAACGFVAAAGARLRGALRRCGLRCVRATDGSGEGGALRLAWPLGGALTAADAAALRAAIEASLRAPGVVDYGCWVGVIGRGCCAVVRRACPHLDAAGMCRVVGHTAMPVVSAQMPDVVPYDAELSFV
eukprot:gene41669-38821_t